MGNLAVKDNLRREFEDLRSDLNQGSIPKVAAEYQQCLDEMQNLPLDIAVTGDVAVGKSSFINAFRGVMDDDNDAAEVAAVEGTKMPKITRAEQKATMGNIFPKYDVRREFDDLKSHLNQGNIPEAAAEYRGYLNKMQNLPLNIAVVGKAGAGKSSFINAFLGISDDDEEAAEVGTVEEKTVPKAHPHPSLPNTTIWELPEIRTCNSKAAEYLKKVQFERYDVFVLIVTDRFTENDAFLAKEIQRRRKKFYFVRSKIDITIEGERRKRNFNMEQTLETIRNYCEDTLKGAAELSARVFLVSNTHAHMYEFPLLRETMATELPDYKKHLLTLAVHVFSENNLMQKKICMNFYIKKLAIVSCLGGALPVVKKVQLERYDVFLIITSDRFTENDALLAKEIKRMRKKCYYVRARIDESIKNESRKRDFNEMETLSAIRKYCEDGLKKAAELSKRVFLISNHHVHMYDFRLLQETMAAELPDHKKHILTLAVHIFSENELMKKKELMKAYIKKIALVSCAFGAVPLPGLSVACDVGILIDALICFCHVFGLDDRSLHFLARQTGKEFEELRSAIKKTPLLNIINTELVASLLLKSSVWVTVSVVELALKIIPVLGSLIGGASSYLVIRHCLKSFLDDAVEDAQNVRAKLLE